MKKYLLIIIFASVFSVSKSQTVVLEQNVKADTIGSKFGQNQKHFRHFYIEFGMISPPEEKGAEINYGKSGFYKIGMKYKLKVCNFYAIGFDVSFTNQNFSLVQNFVTKQIPNSIIHDKENIIVNNLGTEFYNRFNFGKRGNIIGKYIDLGVFANFSFDKKHKTFDKSNVVNSSYSNKQKVVNSGIIYVQDFQYGANARIGINRFALNASYRLSDIFKSKSDGISFNYPELPRLNIGLQIGLF
jgi:hypothetical protein